MAWEILASAGTVLLVIFVVGFCIFSHELGHFLAGKWRKLHIDAFSIGFRKIWGKKINGVEYRIGWLPLGGYVELPQVDAADEVIKAADGTVLPRAKPLDRMITAAAGPAANILCGMTLAVFVWYFGVPQDSPSMKRMTVAKIAENSPEYRAGLREGDVIVKLNGQSFNWTWMKFAENIMYTVGSVRLEVERAGKTLEIRYVPVDNPDAPGRLGREKIGYPFFSVAIPLEVTPLRESPAEKAGIRKGDILLAVDGQHVESMADIRQILALSEKTPVMFTVRRETEILQIPVVPEKEPSTEDVYKIGIVFSGDGVPRVGTVIASSPAAEAGILPGDILAEADGVRIASPQDMIELVDKKGAKPFRLTVKRGEKIQTFELTPVRLRYRTIGASFAFVGHPTPAEQFGNIFNQTFKALRGMFVAGAHRAGLTARTSTLKPRHMSGPVGISTVLYRMFRHAPVMTAVYFIVVFMFALAIFNLLPLPVLDGGHIAFALIEMVFRKPLPAKVIKGLSAAFVGLLILLMLYVTYFDVLRLLPERKPVQNAEKNNP